MHLVLKYTPLVSAVWEEDFCCRLQQGLDTCLMSAQGDWCQLRGLLRTEFVVHQVLYYLVERSKR